MVPLVIEQMLFLAVGTIDTVMITNLGEAAVSGVSLGDMINCVVACAFAALGTGGAVVASQCLGGKRLAQARESASHLLCLALAMGVLIMTPMYFLREPLLKLLFGKIANDVLDAALVYFGITIFTYPLMSGYAACTAIFRSMNRSNVCMYFSLLTNVLNLVGNWLLIFVFKMGVAGAAVSTLISRLVTLALLVLLLADRRREIWLNFTWRFHINWRMVHSILFIGIPSGIENALFSLGRLLVVAIIAKFGTMELAANAVANMICGVTNMVGGACCLAIITVIGQSVGTGSEATVRYYVRKMTIWSEIGYAAWALVILPFLPLIVRCFHGLAPETMHLAIVLILMHCLVGAVLWTPAFSFPNVLRAANDVKYTMWVSVLSMGIVRIGVAWFLATVFHIGAIGVWSAMLCDWVVRIFFFVRRYRSGRWVALAHLK